MADIRCDKCGASWEWEMDAEVCPNCGFSAIPGQAAGGPKAVDDLFDRGGTTSLANTKNGEVARLKTLQQTIEKIEEESGVRIEEQGDPPENTQGDGAQDDPANDHKRDRGQAEENQGEVEGQAEADRNEVVPGSSAGEVSPAGEEEDDDLDGNTVELEDTDVEIAAVAQKPPPPPQAGADGGKKNINSPIKEIRRNTLELDQADLLEVAVDATPPSMPPTIPESPADKHFMRGRVACPIREDQTPLPSTLPKDVDELAVAGMPPTPHRHRRALNSQTEQLSAISARKRGKSNSLRLGVFLVGLGLMGIWLFLSSGPNPVRNDGQPDSGVSTRLSSRTAVPSIAHPDAAPRDLAAADEKPADQQTPDQQQTDRGQKRILQRGATTQKGKPLTPSRLIPRPVQVQRPATPGPVALKGEAQDLYRQGILLLMRGDSMGAVNAFKEGVTINPNFSLAYRGLGLAYEKLNQKAMARASFQRYLILNSEAPDAESIQKRIKSLE